MCAGCVVDKKPLFVEKDASKMGHNKADKWNVGEHSKEKGMLELDIYIGLENRKSFSLKTTCLLVITFLHCISKYK